MILIDVKCTNAECGIYVADALVEPDEAGNIKCPTCKSPMVQTFTPVRMSGPTGDKPLTIKQIDKTFTSAGEAREYCKKHNVEFVDKSDSSWTRHVNQVRELNEKRAVSQGYKDLEHKKETIRRDPRISWYKPI